MGAATALFTAIAAPSRIEAIILIRLPTAYAARAARRHNLIRSAQKLKNNSDPENSLYHHVLTGATQSDLPDISLIAQIECHVLIVALKGDDAHPVETSVAVFDAITAYRASSRPSESKGESQIITSPMVQIHISENVDFAAVEFPVVIESFLKSILPLSKNISVL